MKRNYYADDLEHDIVGTVPHDDYYISSKPVDLNALGERTITLDCDVLEADGGTRTASITGAMVALTCAIDRMIREKSRQSIKFLGRKPAKICRS